MFTVNTMSGLEVGNHRRLKDVFDHFPAMRYIVSDQEPDTTLTEERIIIIPKSNASVKEIVLYKELLPTDLDTSKQWALNRIKQQHAHALLTLTDSATPEERDTWPMKTKYEAFHSSALLAAETHNKNADAANQIEIDDGHGLSTKQKNKIQAALIPGETINEYLANTLANIEAFETLAFFAEGFKRKTNLAIKSAETVEQISETMEQAAIKMKAAMTDFQQQLGQS